MRYTRLAPARTFILLAMRFLRPDDWAFERLWWVNDSLKMQMAKRPRAPGKDS